MTRIVLGGNYYRDSTQIDDILTTLSNVSNWTGAGLILLNYSQNDGRTSASDGAVTTITTNSGAVFVNASNVSNPVFGEDLTVTGDFQISSLSSGVLGSDGSGNISATNASEIYLVLATEVSSNTTATIGTELPVNCTSGAVTITPPASPTAGQKFAVFDSRGQAATNNITVDTSGDNLNSSASDYVISVANGYVELMYVNSTIGWRIKD